MLLEVVIFCHLLDDQKETSMDDNANGLGEQSTLKSLALKLIFD
jgi:hypothetical protein